MDIFMLHSRPSFRKPDEELENVSESRLTLRRNQEETPLNRYQKLENPPSSLPPPPPSNNGNNDTMRLHSSATANFSKAAPKSRSENKSSQHGIYSSNDSGFSNELAPVAPEVDYSDDDEMPKKIPIR